MIAGPGFWDLEIERAGWSRVMWPTADAYPETAGRLAVWGRNFYVRGSERLIIEWSDPVTLSAVLLNGEPRQVSSAETLAAAIQLAR